MPFTITGWNPFYEGWLAKLLGQPRAAPSALLAVDRDGWNDGWDMANETSVIVGLADVIKAEVRLKHVTVTATPFERRGA